MSGFWFPFGEQVDGRDHNHHGFSVWLAGGGIKGGLAYGSTDDFGYRAVENRVHIHDLHATLLHQMSFDHERLTYGPLVRRRCQIIVLTQWDSVSPMSNELSAIADE